MIVRCDCCGNAFEEEELIEHLLYKIELIRCGLPTNVDDAYKYFRNNYAEDEDVIKCMRTDVHRASYN